MYNTSKIDDDMKLQSVYIIFARTRGLYSRRDASPFYQPKERCSSHNLPTKTLRNNAKSKKPILKTNVTIIILNPSSLFKVVAHFLMIFPIIFLTWSVFTVVDKFTSTTSVQRTSYVIPTTTTTFRGWDTRQTL